jgi:long-subunit fatty acid transport protein
MRSRLLGLFILIFLLFSVSASGEQKFDAEAKVDTIQYFIIHDFLLSPFPLTDCNFLGGGAKARGMGGAFFAVSNDPTAASWNPAGLSQLDKAQMNLSFSSYMYRTEYTSTSNLPNWNYRFSGNLKHDVNAISFASIVIPFKLGEKEVVGGVLYQRLADIYQENSYAMVLDSVVDAWWGDTLENYLPSPIDEKVTGRLDQVSISLGWKLFKSLSLGAGVNIYTGKFTSDANFFAQFAGFNDVLYVDTTGLNGYKFRPTTKSDYSGFNFTMGAMYTWDKLRLAGVVKTPFTLKEDNDVKLLTDIIEGGIVSQYSYLYSPLFKTDRKWKMPLMMGFGTSYLLNDLTLAADLEFRNYSKTELTYRANLANPSATEITTSMDWRDLTQFRIGGEYVFHTKVGDIPLRVGFRNDPQLLKTQLDSSEVFLRMDMQVFGTDTSYTPAFVQSNHGVEKGSWVNGNVFSFGTGIAWSQIRLDITYEYAQYDDINKEVFTDLRPFDRGRKILLDPWERQKFSKEESNKSGRIMISFTGIF